MEIHIQYYIERCKIALNAHVDNFDTQGDNYVTIRPLNLVVKNATTVKNYLSFLENTYLIFLVSKYDFSIKKQIQNPKKIYFIELGIVRELGFHHSEDNGRLLENLVFIELKRRGKEIYYHAQKHECDFLIKEKNRIVEAIQVSWSIHNPTTREGCSRMAVMELHGG